VRLPGEIAEARKAGTGPPGKELTEKQKESKRKKKKELAAVSFLVFLACRAGGVACISGHEFCRASEPH
jgi:hypothetical protein